MFLSTQSVGVRRVSLVLGLVAAVYRFMNPGLYDNLYYDSPEHFVGIVLTCLLYFLCAWVPIRVIAWIVSGFLSDRTRNSR
jgi:hypothetical protein